MGYTSFEFSLVVLVTFQPLMCGFQVLINRFAVDVKPTGNLSDRKLVFQFHREAVMLSVGELRRFEM